MITLATARERVMDHLHQTEAEINLPRTGDGPKIHLLITEEQEHEFGWVFFYGSREYMESGDIQYAIAGNGPILVDRCDGTLHATGTSRPWRHHVEEFRKSRNKSPSP